MKELRYDILFNGELLPGFDSATVAANLARRFKATPATIARLMNGDSHVLKRATDYDTAVKYRSAMEQDGEVLIRLRIRRPSGQHCHRT